MEEYVDKGDDYLNHWELVNSGKIVVSDTAEDLWRRMASYFKWCDEHPLEYRRTVSSGKEAGREYTEYKIRPYTIKAMCLHCGIFEEQLRDIRQGLDKTNDYYIVVSKALYIIYGQVAEQAMVGEFSPSFSAKMLGVDKEEVPESSIKIEVVHGLPALSNSENEILEKLESEKPLL